MDRYEVLLREDRPDQAVAQMRRQDADFRAAQLELMEQINRNGWDQERCLETLAERYQTYALEPIPGDGRFAMLTREVGTNRFTYLGVTRVFPPHEAVYRAACTAHGLRAPSRRLNDAMP